MMTHETHDETRYKAGYVAPVGARYTLVMRNESGASEQTTHGTKRGIRDQIRTWEAGQMTCSVLDSESGSEIYSGRALGF